MARINTGKLVLGGLAAGLVINIVETIMNVFVLAGTMETALAAMNLQPLGGSAMGGFVVLAFTVGLLIVWTYAAIRPRYGAGAGTAMRAGFAVWVGFYLLSSFANWLMGMMPTRLFLHMLLYSLPMMLIAAYVGGMLYKED